MERLEARVTESEKELMIRAAQIQGLTLTDYAVCVLIDASHRVVQEDELIQLSAADRTVFVDALLHPPPPAERLKRAAARHKELLGG